MEFRPGQDYFFISTSDPQNLHQRSGGRCSSHNMKVLFKTAERKMERKNHKNDFSKQDVALDETTLKVTKTAIESDAIDNDVSKVSFFEEARIVELNRRPSQKLDPTFYYPIRQESETDDDDDDVPQIETSENEVFSNYRRQSRNEEDVKLEASRMSSGVVCPNSSFRIPVVLFASAIIIAFFQ
jgi:hypothetical protein